MVDYKKTAWKVAWVAGAGAVTALIGWLSALPVEPNQAIYVTIAMSVLLAVQDIIKHWSD